jgi:hypothetical protein
MTLREEGRVLCVPTSEGSEVGLHTARARLTADNPRPCDGYGPLKNGRQIQVWDLRTGTGRRKRRP